jgi:hypothetical protein
MLGVLASASPNDPTTPPKSSTMIKTTFCLRNEPCEIVEGLREGWPVADPSGLRVGENDGLLGRLVGLELGALEAPVTVGAREGARENGDGVSPAENKLGVRVRLNTLGFGSSSGPRVGANVLFGAVVTDRNMMIASITAPMRRKAMGKITTCADILSTLCSLELGNNAQHTTT